MTFVGHATAMITTPSARILTDPLLENSLYGIRAGQGGRHRGRRPRRPGPGAGHPRPPGSPVAQEPGPAARAAPLVVPPHCERLVRRFGLCDGRGAGTGAQLRTRRRRDDAVPVRHSGTRGLGDYARRGASGYADPTPAHVSHLRRGRHRLLLRLRRDRPAVPPDVALLPIAGDQPAGCREAHLSPLDAVVCPPGSARALPRPHRLRAVPAQLRAAGRAARLAAADHARARHLPMCGQRQAPDDRAQTRLRRRSWIMAAASHFGKPPLAARCGRDRRRLTDRDPREATLRLFRVEAIPMMTRREAVAIRGGVDGLLAPWGVGCGGGSGKPMTEAELLHAARRRRSARSTERCVTDKTACLSRAA